jgi:polysaccharide export outer membrane protein
VNLIDQAGLTKHWWSLAVWLFLSGALPPVLLAETPEVRPLVQTAPLEGRAKAPGGVGAGAGITNTSYVLSVNDLVKVEVYKEDDLRREGRIDQDGTISLPLIQTVRVGGRTIADAREMIRRLYEKDYLVSADVSVTLVASSQTNKVVEPAKPKLKFTVSGEVKKPGVVEIPEGEKINLVQAIMLAGDFTTLANQKSVTVKREEKGGQKVYTENVQSMLRDSKSKPFEVLPGDVIVVRQTIF